MVKVLTGGEKLGSGRLNRKGLRVNQNRVNEMMFTVPSMGVFDMWYLVFGMGYQFEICI